MATRAGILLSAALALVAGAKIQSAHACGCFTPPDPSVPVVQAGEKIAFALENGSVTAHIQIQYSGPAEEFGWLLPLPSEPRMELGTDELFAQLIATTQPKYKLNREYQGSCAFDPSNNRFADAGASAGEGPYGPPSDVVVRQDTIGPYDYAVLRADERQPMLDWLAANHYFVPVGTEDVVGPYIRPNAFFLALKLRKGNDLGDLQPVVVRYASDLPMIPIVLTSVAADPDMGVMVWVLGQHRAIPRNYYHTLVNDAQIDWLNFGQNYGAVVTRAVDEAPGHHSFVTEYAGTSTVMKDLLDYQGRFGNLDELARITDAAQYIQYLLSNGYAVQAQSPFGFTQLTFTSQMLGILQSYLPEPAELVAQGILPSDYYLSFQYYTQTYAPQLGITPDVDFDPVAMTADIKVRVVDPTLSAGQMFRRNSYMTRLFTTLSPEEMTRDPVFSYNPMLSDVANVREGRLIYHCGLFGSNDSTTAAATIVTSDGWKLELPQGTAKNPWLTTPMPASLRTEILPEDGAARLVTDNTDLIVAAISGESSGGGCAVGSQPRSALGLSALGLVGVASILRLIRRRRGR